MKTKTLSKFLILMISFFCLGTIQAQAAPIGHLDSVEGETISGWARGTDIPQGEVPVTVTITNQANGQAVKELTTVTSIYREELSQMYGEGNYGFQVVVPWNQLEDGYYIVTAATSQGTLPNILTYNKGDVQISQTGRSLGVFKTTAYCPCYGCSRNWGRQTSSGAVARANHTVAVDKSVIPMGSKLLINGTVYTVEDVGGGVKGNHVDIFFNTHGEARQYGKRNVEVFLLN